MAAIMAMRERDSGAAGDDVPPRSPAAGAASGGDFTEVCALDDIPPLGARVIERNGHPDGNVAVFRTADDRAFAVLDRCPHKGGPLSEGIVYGDRVACPLHNWSIELASGCASAPDEGCARTYPVRIERGIVSVALD
jgi:nitrite reductase (NADH) small subunit